MQVRSRRAWKKGFVDSIRVLVEGGDGGNGCASTFRDTRVMRGGPDGGDGGAGGDVVLRACHNVSDLAMAKRNFKAARGSHGSSQDMHGARGKSLELRVPCGTDVVRLGSPSVSMFANMEQLDAPRYPLGELLRDGDRLLVAQGGRGGRGNAAFQPGLQQHSQIAEDGGPGAAATLLLSLKLIADVGLVGFPNVGKSSLLRAISNATPKVAAYPFTTLHPNLGRVHASDLDVFTVADVPGLIGGAHDNRGLGHAFLRHVERTSLLCYVLDLTDPVRPPFEQLTLLRRELALYQPGLENHPSLIAGNKADTDGAAAALRLLRAQVVRLRATGGFPGLLGGEDATGNEAVIATPSVGGSVVTAVSALHAGNLAMLVQRMHLGLRVAADSHGSSCAATTR